MLRKMLKIDSDSFSKGEKKKTRKAEYADFSTQLTETTVIKQIYANYITK